MARKNPPPAPKRRLRDTKRPTLARMQQFVANYIVTRCGKDAAIAAGYSKNGAAAIGSRLLKDPRVEEMMAERALKASAAADVKAADILKALMEIAYLDPAECFDPAIVIKAGKDGKGQRSFILRLKDITELPVHVRRAIASFKVVKKNLVAGDGESDDLIEVKFWNKPKALEILAQHAGLLNIKIDLNITTEQVKRMDDATLFRETQKDMALFSEQMELRKRIRLAVNAEAVSG